MAWTVLLSIFALWTDRVLERGPTEIDFLFMYMGLVGAVTQFVVTGPLAKKIGEMRILHLTAVGLLLGFLGLTFTDSIVLILICLKVLSAANSLFTPGVDEYRVAKLAGERAWRRPWNFSIDWQPGPGRGSGVLGRSVCEPGLPQSVLHQCAGHGRVPGIVAAGKPGPACPRELINRKYAAIPTGWCGPVIV